MLRFCRFADRWFIALALIVVLAFCPLELSAKDKKPKRSKKGMVKLDLELPLPMFMGTPKDLRSSNLETSEEFKNRPTILVPKGIENVALDKPVTSSDEEPIIGDVDFVTDGDKEGVDGSYVELGPRTQWVQIDLGRAHEVYAVAVWHFHSAASVYHDVVIQVADSPEFADDVQTVFNNDHDNSSGLGIGENKEYIETFKGRVIETSGVSGRHVRLTSNGNTSNDQNHYVEVEVYAREAE